MSGRKTQIDYQFYPLENSERILFVLCFSFFVRVSFPFPAFGFALSQQPSEKGLCLCSRVVVVRVEELGRVQFHEVKTLSAILVDLLSEKDVSP